MAAYVDNARIRYARIIMCHMLVDTIGELLKIVDDIQLDRRQFQPLSHPHFDISLTCRMRAVAAGAIEVERCGVVLVKM